MQPENGLAAIGEMGTVVGATCAAAPAGSVASTPTETAMSSRPRFIALSSFRRFTIIFRVPFGRHPAPCPVHSLVTVAAPALVTQMLAPSKAAADGRDPTWKLPRVGAVAGPRRPHLHGRDG